MIILLKKGKKLEIIDNNLNYYLQFLVLFSFLHYRKKYYLCFENKILKQEKKKEIHSLNQFDFNHINLNVKQYFY